MALKIVLTDCETVTANDLDLGVLEKFGEVTYYPETPAELTAARIKDADIVIFDPDNAHTIHAATNLHNCDNSPYEGY